MADRKTTIAVSAALAALVVTAQAKTTTAATDGKTDIGAVVNMCASCHGKRFDLSAGEVSVPLSKISAERIAELLGKYKDGKRKIGYSCVMNNVVANIDRKDFQKIAEEVKRRSKVDVSKHIAENGVVKVENPGDLVKAIEKVVFGDAPPNDANVVVDKTGVGDFNIDGFATVVFHVERDGHPITGRNLAFWDGRKLIVGAVSYPDTGMKKYLGIVEKENEELRKQVQAEREKEISRAVEKAKMFAAHNIVNGLMGDVATVIEGGDKNGTIYVVYTDPQCPACKRFESEILDALVARSNKVYIVDFPLDKHKEAFMRCVYRHALSVNGTPPLEAVKRSSSDPYDKVVETVFAAFGKDGVEKYKKRYETVKKESGVLFTPTVIDMRGGLVKNFKEIVEEYKKSLEKNKNENGSKQTKKKGGDKQ